MKNPGISVAALSAWLLAVAVAGAQDVLPRPAAPFAGTIGPTVDQSKPDWPRPAKAPKEAPNILLIMTDDVGFAATSAFGGPIPHAESGTAGGERSQIHRIPYDRSVLADAGGFADRPQPSRGRLRQPGGYGAGLSRL